MVEVFVDCRMDGCEFLQTSHLPEPEHGAFSSSEGEMRAETDAFMANVDATLVKQVFYVSE